MFGLGAGSFMVNSYMKVSELKDLIYETYTYLGSTKFILTYKTKLLKDDDTLGDHDITSGSSILLLQVLIQKWI